MKDIKDLIPFCVNIKGLAEEERRELENKLLRHCASYNMPCDNTWKYFGVDDEEETMCWDNVEDFSASEDVEVKIIPYDQIDEFLGLVDEDLSTPAEDSSPAKSAAKQARDSDVIATPLILPAEDGGVRDTRKDALSSGFPAESFNTLETLQSLCKDHSLSITIDGGDVVVRSIALDKEFSVGTMQELTKVTDALAVLDEFIVE